MHTPLLTDKNIDNPSQSIQRPFSPESTDESGAEAAADNIRLAKIKKGKKSKNRPSTKEKDNQQPLSLPASELPSSGNSIQAEGYAALSGNESYAALDAFLSALSLNRDNLPAESLLKLFQQETGRYHWLKWCYVDSVVEKSLQGLLLKHSDLKPDDAKGRDCARLKPAERSLPLQNTNGLRKAYFARGVVKGIEIGVFESVHYFIYAMLSYRFVKLIQTGTLGLDELFSGSDQKGIDSLVQLLAQVEAGWLEFILTIPLVLGAMSGLWGIRRAKLLTSSELTLIESEVKQHLSQSGGIWRDVIREILPGISNVISLSAKIQKLEQTIRWDGRLSSADWRKAFQLIVDVAKKGKKRVRLTALQSLAKLAQSTGFNDLQRLKDAGYSPADLQFMLPIKATALAELIAVAGEEKGTEHAWSNLPARLYAHYLLWWLGQSTSTWRQRLPFALIKAIKLTLEVYFLYGIITSILEAIHCPDKQGFELGFGYPATSTELTPDCFIQLFENTFRTFNLSDPVDQLLVQIPLFNLIGLGSLTSDRKNLTGQNMVDILTAMATRGAALIELEIYDYFSDADMQALAAYLPTSNIQMLVVGCSESEYPGGEGLSSQGLHYLTEVLPYTRLTSLQLCFPNVDDPGVIALANTLPNTQINRFYLEAAITDTAGQILAGIAAQIPITRLRIRGSYVGDGTVKALPYLKSTTLLQISGNWITDQGAQYFAQMLLNTSVNVIQISSTNITDTGVIALVESLKQLLSLTIQVAISSSCGEAGMMALAQQLNQTQFWSLALTGNTFTQSSMAAFADALSISKLTWLWLGYQRFSPEMMSLLAEGVAASSISTMGFDHAELNNTMIELASSLTQLNTFQITSSHLTDDDLRSLVDYLPGSDLEALYLSFNTIGDTGVEALAKVLPETKITLLALIDNVITDIGAQTLADIYASTQLQELYLSGNNISGNLLSQVESFEWNTYCQDQLCHANTQYHGNPSALQSQRKLSAPHRDSLQGERRRSALTTHRSSFTSEDNHAPKNMPPSSSRALVPSSRATFPLPPAPSPSSLPLATSSATRLQPFFISYFLSWSRPWTSHLTLPALPSSPSKTESPLPIQFSFVPSVVTFSPERPCHYPDGGNNIGAEIWRDAKGLPQFVTPGGLDISGKAIMPLLPRCQMPKPVASSSLENLSFSQLGFLAGASAVLHGAAHQGLTTVMIARGHAMRTTRYTVAIFHFAFIIACSAQNILSSALLLLPLAANKAVTVGARQLPKGDWIAAPLGMMVGLLIVVIKNATAQGLFILAITLLVSRTTEKLIHRATIYLLPAAYQSLEPQLLQGKIASLRRELQRAESLLADEIQKHPQQDFQPLKDRLQQYTAQLNAIQQDHHATLKTMVELRRPIRQLQNELSPNKMENPPKPSNAKNSVQFFQLPYPVKESVRSGCFERICGCFGF